MEDFVPFELAVKLKEKGFDWETSNVYERNTIACRYEDYPKPTISQVLKWLREKKNMHIIVEISDSGWYYTLYPNVRWVNDKLKSDTYIMSFKHKTSYEQATLAGIEYVLENLI